MFIFKNTENLITFLKVIFSESQNEKFQSLHYHVVMLKLTYFNFFYRINTVLKHSSVVFCIN